MAFVSSYFISVTVTEFIELRIHWRHLETSIINTWTEISDRCHDDGTFKLLITKKLFLKIAIFGCINLQKIFMTQYPCKRIHLSKEVIQSNIF